MVSLVYSSLPILNTGVPFCPVAAVVSTVPVASTRLFSRFTCTLSLVSFISS